jgi:uncharacterized protein (TIGR03067 family)
VPATSSSPAPSAAAGRPRGDLDDLQGVWASVAGPREARLLICGSRFTFELSTGDIYMGTLVLDLDAQPKRMDMRVEEGPARHRGQTAFCIYHLDGGVLRWCPTRPGCGTRLTGFPSVDDDRYLSLVFRRVRSPRG